MMENPRYFVGSCYKCFIGVKRTTEHSLKAVPKIVYEEHILLDSTK